MGRASFSSSNPFQSDLVSIADGLEDSSITTNIIPSPILHIAPPQLPITTIQHTNATSPSISPNKLPTELTPTPIVKINLPPTKVIKNDKFTTTRRTIESTTQSTRQSILTRKLKQIFDIAGYLFISSAEMLEVTTKFKQLENQLHYNMTMIVAVFQYEVKMAFRRKLNLPAHVFWTTHSVMDPDTEAFLQYKDFNLSPNAHQWLRGYSNEMVRLTHGVRPYMLTRKTLSISSILPTMLPIVRIHMLK